MKVPKMLKPIKETGGELSRSNSSRSEGSYSGRKSNCSACSERSSKMGASRNSSVMSSHESIFANLSDEGELEDNQLGIPYGDHGLPEKVPFATLGTGQYLGLKYVFDPDYKMVTMYAKKSTHLLVLD